MFYIKRKKCFQNPELPDTRALTYRQRLRSSSNAPNLGEFNTKKVSPFLEPDPNLECRFKNGVIIIATETRQIMNNQRHQAHMGTRYDNRNDPSWHAKGSQLFSVAAIVTNGEESVEVPDFASLGLRDSEGNLVNQNLLDEHLSYLNGKKLIGSFSAKTTIGRYNQGQRSLTRWNQKRKEFGQTTMSRDTLLESQDRRRILDNLDRQFLQV